MGEVGEEIPHLEEDRELLDPDTSHLSMGEVGEVIDAARLLAWRAQCLAPHWPLQAAAETPREEAAPPDTSHISLDDES